MSLRQGIQPICYVDSIKHETFINTKPPFLHHCSSPVELLMHLIMVAHFPLDSFHVLCFNIVSLYNFSFYAAALIFLVLIQNHILFAAKVVVGMSDSNKINVNNISGLKNSSFSPLTT